MAIRTNAVAVGFITVPSGARAAALYLGEDSSQPRGTGVPPTRDSQDLRRNPENGWFLSGLRPKLCIQHNEAAAQAVEDQQAWSHADIRLTTARF
jgi:hypothetical protein